MSSNYQNFRKSVPWLIIFLEAVFIILFAIFFSCCVAQESEIFYPVFQDVNHMVIFGFGFFLMFLKRYGFSSVGFNLLIFVLGVQCSMLIDSILFYILELKIQECLNSITESAMSMTAVLISTGAVLGKMNPVQLILMTVVEITAFCISRFINKIILKVTDSISMMHVHPFGAYFGLAASLAFSEPSPRSEKNASTPTSNLFSMLGTLFLWVFWPSFNSVLAESNKNTAFYNTYFALAVSAVTAFLLSSLTTKDGKFRMSHIHSAALAGGIAVGYTAQSIEYPWIAMILGLLASVITILGSCCLQRCLNPALKLHDTSGVHFTFGLPAVLGVLAQVVLFVINNTTVLPSYDLFYSVMINIGAFCMTITVAVITGFITGFILNSRLFKKTPVSKYFEDQVYWEFPHLAVGF